MEARALNSGWESGRARFAAVLRSVLSKKPSVLERLLYLAALRNPETCDAFLREHHLVGFTISEVDHAIWEAHLGDFQDWLALNLEEKLADLEYYASREGKPLADAANEWFAPTLLARLIPRRAQAPEVRLFRSDVQLLVTIVAGKD